jgi:copper resistance protein D
MKEETSPLLTQAPGQFKSDALDLQRLSASATKKSRRPNISNVTTLYSFSLLLHLIALALWLGGIVFLLVVLGPAVHELEPRIAITTLNRGRLGLETASWIAIGLLLLTGVFNLFARMSVNGATMGESYGILLSVKLLVFGAMVGHHCLQVFKYAPAIASLTGALPQATASWPEPLLSHWRRWFLLLKINAALGPIAVLLGLALTQT